MAEESAGGKGRPIYESFFEEWSRTRGPLFDYPPEAICRILAICAVHHIRHDAPERELRIRAARVLDEALTHVPDANIPASRETRARVNMGLVDIQRLLRDAPDEEDLVRPLAKILGIAAGCVNEIELLRILALAELLAAVFDAERLSVRLRAARTLIARTRDAARRVGRPKLPGLPDTGANPPESDAPVASADPGGAGEPPAGHSHESGADHDGRAPP